MIVRMPWDNSLNPGKGRAFEILAAKQLGSHFGIEFELDVPIAIGSPPKLHRFDLVSADRAYVGECKSYTWTETGNMPSAKMAFLNEAVLYLSHLPTQTHRFIVMLFDLHPKRSESLVQYYIRTYRHLLSGIELFELDPNTGRLDRHLP